MNTKFKFIFSIFILVALLYVLHFTLSYMNKQKRLERFEEEKESFVEPEDKDYGLRMKILEDVDRLNVKDKVIKAKLVDYLLSDPILKDLASKNTADRFTFIRTTYKNMVGTSEITSEETYVVPGVKPPKEAFDQDVMQTVDSKVDELMKHVSNLHASVDDLKNISRQKPYPAMLVEQENIALPNLTPKIPSTDKSIEGFENKREYFSYK